MLNVEQAVVAGLQPARFREPSLGSRVGRVDAQVDDFGNLKKFRKRITLNTNFEVLEVARSLGFTVAINIIADPDWDRERFRVIRDWCLEVPEIVNLSVNTPYPGTETWLTESRRLQTRDYRLFDIQHAVLPTKRATSKRSKLPVR